MTSRKFGQFLTPSAPSVTLCHKLGYPLNKWHHIFPTPPPPPGRSISKYFFVGLPHEDKPYPQKQRAELGSQKMLLTQPQLSFYKCPSKSINWSPKMFPVYAWRSKGGLLRLNLNEFIQLAFHVYKGKFWRKRMDWNQNTNRELESIRQNTE